MKKYGIPTAKYETFDDMEDALAYLDSAPIPTVIKADGLALGKGVIIAQSTGEAKQAVISMMQDKQFGKSGERIVIEEFLEGPEVSVLSFTDGKTVVPMISSMDHKRIGDGDTGLNTGGMGTIAPNPYYTEDVAKRCMVTKDGPKVIEYNCRFGDPETQVVLPLLESDLLTVMQAVTNGTLAETEVKFSDKHACCVILASEGYPVSYKKGFPISIPADVLPCTYIAGAKKEMGQLVTSGGRVLGVTAVADSLKEAIDASYAMAEQIRFEGAYKRSDIGARALKAVR